MKMPKYKILGIILLALGFSILIVVAYYNNPRSHIPLVFSEKSLLQNVWTNYKTNYIESTSGRTFDKNSNNVTTSEGESYTMLRAVWMDDKATFDQSLNFSKNNLKRPSDSLFSWLYGQRSDKSYGVLTSQGGQNTASDADADIALALIFASHRWNDASYLSLAKTMINDIWKEDVVIVQGKPYMGADNFEHAAKGTAVLNPSYFSPASYRIFSTIDKTHDWMALVSDSYQVLRDSASSTLDKNQSAGLPPDWVLINTSSGKLTASSAGNLNTDYGYDAFRIPWRLALDWQWFHATEAKQTLDTFSFLSREWNANHLLHSSYSHDGSVTGQIEAPAMYGGSIGYFMVSDDKNAKDVYTNKLLFLYDQDTSAWKEPLSYYDDNWAWFGIALYNNLLPNLAAIQ
jgi:endo-1,4-beta-D-glucanase Y